MSAFNKFNAFVQDIAHKVHNLQTDTLKIMLTNVAPAQSNSVKADLTEIAAGNGYSAGGQQMSQTSSGQINGLYKLVLADTTIVASGGNIGPFRYAVLYNDTPAFKPLIGWWDYGSSTTLIAGETLPVDADPVNSVLQLS